MYWIATVGALWPHTWYPCIDLDTVNYHNSGDLQGKVNLGIVPPIISHHCHAKEPLVAGPPCSPSWSPGMANQRPEPSNSNNQNGWFQSCFACLKHQNMSFNRVFSDVRWVDLKRLIEENKGSSTENTGGSCKLSLQPMSYMIILVRTAWGDRTDRIRSNMADIGNGLVSKVSFALDLVSQFLQSIWTVKLVKKWDDGEVQH